MARTPILRLALCALLAPCASPAAVIEQEPIRLHRPVTGLNGNEDGFARSLVRVGNVALVSAPYDRFDDSGSTGSLYAWRRVGNDWAMTGIVSPVGEGLCGFAELLVGADMHAYATALTSASGCSGLDGTALLRIDVDAAGVPTLGDTLTLELDGDTVRVSDLDGDSTSVAVVGSAYFAGGEHTVLVYDADLQQPPRRLSPPTAATSFAGQVAVSGDWLAASCFEWDDVNRPPGCVHVYRRQSTNAWAHVAQLDAPTSVDAYTFGSDLRFAGERLIVGADAYTYAPALAGAVATFARVDGTWTLGSIITPANGLPGDRFGARLDVDDGDLFVYASARRAGPGYRREGALYRYCDIEDAWQPCGFLEAGEGDEDWPRPEDVAVFDNEILLAQPYFPNAEDGSQGTVARVTRDASLTEVGRFHPGDGGSEYDRFGATVATDGALLAVGAPGYHGYGGVFVYRRVGAAWLLEATLVGERIGANCPGFGSAVAVRGGSVAVTNGCPDEENAAQGYIHFYSRGASGWTGSAHKIPLTDENLGFGHSLLIKGGAVIYGAPQARINGVYNAGAVHVLRYFVLGLVGNVVRAPVLGENMAFGRRIAAHASADSSAIMSDILLAASGEGSPSTVALFHVTGHAFNDAAHLATLSSSEPDMASDYGAALALDAGAVYIGAPAARCPVGADERTGALYRYARVDGVWALTQRTCHPGQERFAGDIALAGDTLIASSIGDSGVRLHEYDSGAGTLDAVATRDDDRAGAYGSPLALSASALAVGAPSARHPATFTATGAVDVYETGLLFKSGFESVDASATP